MNKDENRTAPVDFPWEKKDNVVLAFDVGVALIALMLAPVLLYIPMGFIWLYEKTNLAVVTIIILTPVSVWLQKKLDQL